MPNRKNKLRFTEKTNTEKPAQKPYSALCMLKEFFVGYEGIMKNPRPDRTVAVEAPTTSHGSMPSKDNAYLEEYFETPAPQPASAPASKRDLPQILLQNPDVLVAQFLRLNGIPTKIEIIEAKDQKLSVMRAILSNPDIIKNIEPEKKPK